MPRRVANLLRWSPSAQAYEISDEGNFTLCPATAGSSAWLTWLERITSFAFYSRSGTHCTVRKEDVQGNGAYWYGYRSIKRKTVKRYLGRTADLTLELLEEVADSFTEVPSSPERDSVPPLEEMQPSPATPIPEPARLLPLLEARLHPPRLPQLLVARPHLLARLHDWQQYPLTLLAAPAGAGKTVLLSHWLSEGFPASDAAWLSLDASDNDPYSFCHAVLTACRHWFSVSVQELSAPLLSSPHPLWQPLPLESALPHLFRQALPQGTPRLLILDDYHVISEPRVHDMLDSLLMRLPESLHILLATRSDPPISLVRLRAHGYLNELRAAELRFSYEESVTFLQQAVPVPLPETALRELDVHLEGWAAGLRLLSLSLQGEGTPSRIAHLLSTFRGNHRSVRDYFVAEVLHAQPVLLQDFLLRTCMLTRLTASLCDAMMGRTDSAELLEALERANLFVEALDGNGEWYRYHALFAEAMRHEARLSLGETQVQALLLTASCWFERQGLLEEAVEVAFQAEEYVRAASLIERYIETSLSRVPHEQNLLHAWLDRLPEPLLWQSPLLCFGAALGQIFSPASREQREARGIPERVEVLLARAEEGWRALNDIAHLGEVYALHAHLLYALGRREEALSLARQALAWLSPTEYLWRGISLLVLGIEALRNGQLYEARSYIQVVSTFEKLAGNPMKIGADILLGLICFEQGELRLAADHFRKIDSSGIDEENWRPVMMVVQLFLARISYEENNLEMVQQQIESATALGEQLVAVPLELLQVPLEFLRACLLHAEGRTESALQRLMAALPLLPAPQNELAFYLYQEVLGLLIQFSLALGEISTAQFWFDDLERAFQALSAPPEARSFALPDEKRSALVPQRESLLPADRFREHATVPIAHNHWHAPVAQHLHTLLSARISLAQERVTEAQVALEGLLPLVHATGHTRLALQARLVLARTYADSRQLAEARKVLLEAVEQGYRGGYQRLFLDEGQSLAPLLRDLYPHVRSLPLRNYVQALLQAFAQYRTTEVVVTPIVSVVFEALTAQEQRVLRLLAAGRSNAEIAAELTVSINTIRTHIQSIYRKLQVNSRHSAVVIAREQQLL